MHRESPTHDERLFLVGEHEVMADRLQIVIRHPKPCPGRGSGRDQGKTFHSPRLALEKLEACGVQLTPEQVQMLHVVGQRCMDALR